MALVIDSSRALRSPQEATALARAILAASPNDESDWVEWKNGLVLRDKEARLQIARHILGMANRQPGQAERHAEGCGYVVLGVEPGQCMGVQEIDPADFDAGLRPYLGADGPRWSMQYVKVESESVLVITVEPPRRGDRIFPLEKAFEKYYRGQIFVRRPGSTVPAEPEDLLALQDRLTAADQPVTLHLRPTGADDLIYTSPIRDYEQSFTRWADLRRIELLPQPQTPPKGSRFAVVLDNENLDGEYLSVVFGGFTIIGLSPRVAQRITGT